MENQKQDLTKANFIEENAKHPDQGLDHWNDRLEENLETETSNDIEADEKAKDFSEKYGSGDQSDQGND
ncbi:hypothetical protein OQX63_20960 [Pedobacter sp. PF22-3]|uniref:hypothetical protein n=1 Tax=Pedobacter sp. PF22-3 TaxID=2994467 RepID=UPI002246D20B|nr:hypothetical protein [Pedobacter sp. PF22-3]MCX2495979.1 hypothetical protein [Pedobacter sp. PF22-3]